MSYQIEKVSKKLIIVSEQVRKLVKNPTYEFAEKCINNLMFEILHSIVRDKDFIREIFPHLRNIPHIIEILIKKFNLSKQFEERYLIVQILGELKNPDCLDLFLKEIWRESEIEIPENVGCHTPSEIHNERLLKQKFIHSLGYIKNEASFENLEKIMLNHDSHALQIEAIDTYMWNHQDSEEASKRLIEILPENQHLYIDRPRFTCKVISQLFDEQMKKWIQKWRIKYQVPKILIKQDNEVSNIDPTEEGNLNEL